MWMPAQTVVCNAAPPGACHAPAARVSTLLGVQSVRDLAGIGLQIEVRSARLELEKGGEVHVPQAIADQADDDLVGERRDRQGDIELSPGVQSQLEVFPQQVTGEG